MAKPGGPKQPDMNQLLKQAQKMQEQLMEARAQAAEQEVEGQSGGGVVKVRVTGGMEFRGVTIDPAAVDPDDVELLQDMVTAAVNQAVDQAQQLAAAKMGSVTGGLGGPGGGLGGLGIPGL